LYLNAAILCHNLVCEFKKGIGRTPYVPFTMLVLR